MQNQERTDSATTEIAAANLSKTIRLHLEILYSNSIIMDCRFLLPTLEFFMHAKTIPVRGRLALLKQVHLK